MALTSFYTSYKHQKSFGVLIFSGGIERDQRHESGQYKIKCPVSIKFNLNFEGMEISAKLKLVLLFTITIK